MKICSRSYFLCLNRLFWILLHLLLTTMSMSIWCITFQDPLAMIKNVAYGRCIHDDLRFAIKEQSPQQYDESLPVFPATDVQSSNSQSKSESPTLKNHKFQQSQFVSSAVNLQQSNNNQPSSSKALEQPTLNSTLSHLLPDQSFTSSTLHNISRIRRNNDYSNFSIANKDSIEDFQSFDLNHTSINAAKENLTPTFLFINQTYKPLRLTVWYDFHHMAFANTSIEFERLKQGFDLANEELVKLLSVIPVKGNLLLKRVAACGSYWQDDSSANNKQKCGRISRNYRGEKCLDDFQVPDSHLSGFSTYDKYGNEPNKIHFVDGTGVPNTDIVVYVRSQNTKRCRKGNIIAYAASCQLDQFYRPIAGYANFCPSRLSSPEFMAEKFYLTVLHELFHILGFSRSLFKNFQMCHFEEIINTRTPSGEISLDVGNASLVCSKRSGVVDYIDGRHRILSPSVVTEAAHHFNCSTIGGPLESNFKNLLESSHWDSRYFQPSIMTSSIGAPHLTIIDRMTLALFSDTGWYHVNLSHTPDMIWGKNVGCQFGSLEYCRSDDNPFFCTTSEVEHGCHFLHLDKGVCDSSEFLDSCRIYQAQSNSACWNPANQKNNESWKSEVYSSNSRCFVSNITKSINSVQFVGNRSKRSVVDWEGRCYEMRCNGTDTLEIRVKGAAWVLCKSHKKVEIPGYDGFIICPPTSIMCSQGIKKRTRIYTGTTVCVKITLFFPNLNHDIKSLSSDQSQATALFDIFIDKLVSFVNPLINSTNASVGKHPYAAGDSVFISLVSTLSTSRSCSHAVKIIKHAVISQTFAIEFKGKVFTAIRIFATYTLQPCVQSSDNDSSIKIEPSRKPTLAGSPDDHVSAGVIAVAVVGAVSISVLASISFILYLKSVAPNAVAPDMGLGPEVSYQPPNSRGSFPSVSESGSVGQIQFTV